LAGYERHIAQHGFKRYGAYATVTVREVQREEVETTVYSLETSTGTVIASSGLISHNCFPKDVKALAHMADEAGLHPQLLDAVMKINKDQRHVVIDKLAAELGGAGSLQGTTIAVLGLAFKDNTDDMRDAPSIDIVGWLLEAGATVRVFDPVASEVAQRVAPDWQVTYCADEYDAVAGCAGVIVVTEWKQFRQLNLSRVRDAMAPLAHVGNPVFIDGRNLFDPAEMARLGFRYHGIGRGTQRRNGAPFLSDRRSAGANGANGANGINGSHGANGQHARARRARGAVQ
jgi:hypothetical protein